LIYFNVKQITVVVAISSDAKTDVKENENGVVGGNAPKETVLPMFIMERNILTKEEAIDQPH
jgi:hypothetical protein